MLVGTRSYARFFLMAIVFVGFAYVAFVPEAGAILRVGCLAIVAWSAWSAVDFWCCARRWTIEGGQVLIPTVLDRGRSVSVSTLASARFVDGGVVRYVAEWDPPGGGSRPILAVNIYVSSADTELVRPEPRRAELSRH